MGDTQEGEEKEYRRFVQEGIHQESIWKGVKAQSVLGGEGFVRRLRPYLHRYSKVPEIPKEQRFLNRPSLEDLFGGRTLQLRGRRNERIKEAVERHGYG